MKRCASQPHNWTTGQALTNLASFESVTLVITDKECVETNTKHDLVLRWEGRYKQVVHMCTREHVNTHTHTHTHIANSIIIMEVNVNISFQKNITRPGNVLLFAGSDLWDRLFTFLCDRETKRCGQEGVVQFVSFIQCMGVVHRMYTVGVALCVQWVWHSNYVQWVWYMYQHNIYSSRKYFFSVGIDNKIRICSQEKMKINNDFLNMNVAYIQD